VRKTFLAKHLAFCALKDGYSVTFTRMDKFFKHLRLLAIDGTYERTISSYIRPDILVIVEMTR
jgi:DNA replication protein DnaC